MMHQTKWSALKNFQLAVKQKLFMSLKADPDFYLSICIERHPIISCKTNNLEQNLCTVLQKVEHETSNKSNYDLQNTINGKQTNSFKKRNFEFYSNPIKRNYTDIDDIRRIELENLKISSRLSVFKSKDTSFFKKPNESLFLVTKGKTELIKDQWLLPRDILYKGETIKQALKRILNTFCGHTFTAFVYSHVPIGYSTSLYPLKNRRYTFYFLAKYICGHIHNNIEHKWLNSQELKKILPTSAYVKISPIVRISK